jgi:hypothetical protein
MEALECSMNQGRRTPRIAFVAAAKLCDKKSDRQLTAQVREFSAYGCYVGTLNTFQSPILCYLKSSPSPNVLKP